jgi:hypothetical protein
MVEPEAAIHDGGLPAAAAEDNRLTCQKAEQNCTRQKTSSGGCRVSEDDSANAHDEDHPQKRQGQLPQPDDEVENDFSLPDGFWERQARRMARTPCCHFWTFLVLSILLSIVGMVVGKFTVSAQTGGWQSRGTMIADRQTQLMLLQRNSKYVFDSGETAWVDLTTNVQLGWEDKAEEDEEDVDSSGEDGTRRLASSSKTSSTWIRQPQDADLSSGDWWNGASWGYSQQGSGAPFTSLMVRQRDVPRRLQNQATAVEQQPGSSTVNPFPGCDREFYTPLNMTSYPRLWPIWKMKKRDASALDPQSIFDICVAETKTQAILEQYDLCFGCDTGCLPPFSIVLYARWVIPGGFGMTCEELRDDWAPYQDATATSWTTCVQDIKSALRDGVSTSDTATSLPPSCPPFFSPALVDKEFDQTSRVEYTSSIFATREDRIDELFELADSFHQGSDLVQGVYDTQWAHLNELKVDAALITDAQLSMLSAVVAVVAMIVHTKSLFLTSVGLIQIILSFPVSYLLYKLILGLNFFPFLNFIGIFIVFALGTDDIFVAMDKWKNTRLEHPTASTEFIAAKALPDAAVAMFLTTITTAIAFFATAVCPVAPIKMFAVFCGLLVMFDYFLNILLLFPALCIYDRAVQNSKGKKPNCLLQFGSCRRKNGDVQHNSLIRGVMLGYYDILHCTRYGLLAICVVALGVSGFYATKFSLPENSDVRMLDDSHQFEKNWLWRQDLLQDSLNRVGGSDASVIWGVKPADTGDKSKNRMIR